MGKNPSKNYGILDEIEKWLDTNSEIFNDIFDEWTNFNVIQKKKTPKQEFNCNNCGKCCYCDDFWIYCYASDIKDWLEEKRYDIICSLFPMIDQTGNIGYGFPSQKAFIEKINEIFESKELDQTIKNAFKKIRDVIKKLNTNFNENSDYCIYYNPNVEKHCIIHDIAPFSCQAYPYEHSIFSDAIIPKELSKKYGKIGDENEIESPLCPEESFSLDNKLDSVQCSDDNILAVLIDKVNYLSSTIYEKEFENDPEFDITALLLEFFYSKIKFPAKNKPKLNENFNGSNSQNREEEKKSDAKIVKMSFRSDKSSKK